MTKVFHLSIASWLLILFTLLITFSCSSVFAGYLVCDNWSTNPNASCNGTLESKEFSSLQPTDSILVCTAEFIETNPGIICSGTRHIINFDQITDTDYLFGVDTYTILANGKIANPVNLQSFLHSYLINNPLPLTDSNEIMFQYLGIFTALIIFGGFGAVIINSV